VHESELEMVDASVLCKATKVKYLGQFEYVKQMRVRSKRNLFCILRSYPDLNVDIFLPGYGLHCGEFCVWQILTEHSRREVRKDEENEPK
jgi:hypothetical protein